MIVRAMVVISVVVSEVDAHDGIVNVRFQTPGNGLMT